MVAKLLLSSLISVVLLTGCNPQKRKKHQNRTDFITKQGEKPPEKPADTNAPEREGTNPDSANSADPVSSPAPTMTPSPAPAPATARKPTMPTPAPSAATPTPAPAPAPATSSTDSTSTTDVATPTPATSSTNSTTSNSPNEIALPKIGNSLQPQSGAKSDSPNGTAQSTSTSTSEGRADENSNALELTYEETRHLFTLMTATYGQKAASALLHPAVGKDFNGPDLEANFEGTVQKATYRFLHKKQLIVEFKDFKIPLDKPLDLKANGYTLGGLCVGSKCEVLFVVLYKVTGEQQISEVYPQILKWNGKAYQVAFFMDPEKYREHATKDQNAKPDELALEANKLPPQLRVMHLLEQNRRKHKEQILKAVHARMAKDQSIYSARLFPNVRPNSFSEEFARVKEGITFKLDIAFVEAEMRKPLAFKGLVKKEGVRITDPSSMTLDIYHLIQDQFLLLVFENSKFDSPIQNPVKAIQVKLCQLLEEEGQVYSLCEFLPSSQALGILALEGKIGGPVYTKGLVVQKNGKNEEVPEILKEYKPDFSEPQDPGF